MSDSTEALRTATADMDRTAQALTVAADPFTIADRAGVPGPRLLWCGRWCWAAAWARRGGGSRLPAAYGEGCTARSGTTRSQGGLVQQLDNRSAGVIVDLDTGTVIGTNVRYVIEGVDVDQSDSEISAEAERNGVEVYIP